MRRVLPLHPDDLAWALPAFGTGNPDDPVRATTECRRCAALNGISQPVPVHLPAHVKACTRHGVWQGSGREQQPDVSACPEIIAAQYWASRLLRRLTPQQLILAHLIAAAEITRQPASAAYAAGWNERLQVLHAADRHLSTQAEPEMLTEAAIYPDAIALAAWMPLGSPFPRGSR